MLRYQPKKLTTAQALLVSMGLDDLRLDAHHHPREKHPTKSGPGRVHAEGKDSGRKTARRKTPAGPGFVLHRASAEKQLRRANVALVGIRQHKREERAARTSPLVSELTA